MTLRSLPPITINFFKKHSIWHELYCKKYFFAIGNSGCNGWATELCNNRYLAPYKGLVVFSSHIASILADSCIIRTSCTNIVRCLRSVWACLATVCVIVLCTWQTLWSRRRSHRRCNNGFAFLRFLEFCVVAENKSNCNLVKFYCKCAQTNTVLSLQRKTVCSRGKY